VEKASEANTKSVGRVGFEKFTLSVHVRSGIKIDDTGNVITKHPNHIKLVSIKDILSSSLYALAPTVP
jgi:hypothetical protein